MDFAQFFQHICGYRPYKWQQMVCDLLLTDQWSAYDVLNIPTGTGKTSLMLIWYYALAQQLKKKIKNRLPLRYLHVINRRLVVDGIYEEAKRLHHKLHDESPENKEFRDYFKDVGLEIFRIRGGLGEREKTTPLSPCMPQIYVSTVDGIGSRLLFRSYGTVMRSRSISAALMYFDSLLILDEAHLSVPFSNLISQIQANQTQEIPGIKPIKIIKVSATFDGGNEIPITQEDLRHDLGHRLDKPKRIILQESSKITSVMKQLAETAMQEGHKAISLVCNTVHTARKLFHDLGKIKAKTYLLTGQQRPISLQRKKIKNLLELLKNSDERRENYQGEPLIVVSTQTIEVGVDYDFDFMASELASRSSLVQRAGRLNRSGKLPSADFYVIFDPTKPEIPVYGDDAVKCLDFLKSGQNLTIAQLQNARLPEEKQKTRTQRLTQADCNRLAITMPHLNVDIEPYLAGIKDFDHDVNVVWRNNMDPTNPDLELVKLQGVKPAEVMRLSLYALKYVVEDIGDITDGKVKKNNTPNRFYDLPCVIRRNGQYISGKCVKNAIADDLVILPVSYGGLDAWGWNVNALKPARDAFNFIPQGKLITKVRNFSNVDFVPTIEDFRNKIEYFGRNIEDFSKDIRPYVNDEDIAYYILKPKSVYENNTTSKTLQWYQRLDEHTKLVKYFAIQYITKLGLTSLLDEFGTAADFHDLGKSDPRFQRYMCGDKLIDATVLLGKPWGDVGERVSPRGWRHELASLQIMLDSDIKTTALARHLVGSHHGHFRPYGKTIVDKEHRPYIFELLGKPWISKNSPQVFVNNDWIDLNKQWGFWGLAFLEMVFRLADHAASAYKGEKPWN